ncbi:MAG: amidohydrolase family protein [Betaproteobacteria bacterium]|nr:amidohydrolase family protein [Betaproteobacteria bacterium]
MTEAAERAPRQSLPPIRDTRRPRHQLPAGSTDCHCHTFEDTGRYPRGKEFSYVPAPAPLSHYLRMCETVGLQRTVQINSSIYGFDSTVTLDVIATLGRHRARGVAGIRPDAARAELERLHAGGIRGARLSTKVKGYGGTELIDVIAGKIKPLGWHLDLHLGGVAEVAALESHFLKLPVPLVFDHMGSVRGKEGAGAPGFQALLRILRQRDDCWAKISSWYRLSEAGPPDWPDMKPMAQALIEARPDRLVWGSNWPHPNRYQEGDVPNDGDLIDAFCDWVPDAAIRERILVANPARLYGFAPPSGAGN